jgi:hypothetical protein
VPSTVNPAPGRDRRQSLHSDHRKSSLERQKPCGDASTQDDLALPRPFPPRKVGLTFCFFALQDESD